MPPGMRSPEAGLFSKSLFVVHCRDAGSAGPARPATAAAGEGALYFPRTFSAHFHRRDHGDGVAAVAIDRAER